MTEADALNMIKEALNIVADGMGDKVSMETDLHADDILDSLDTMNFMFELEHLHGSKIEQVTETFDDYRVATIVGFLTANA